DEEVNKMGDPHAAAPRGSAAVVQEAEPAQPVIRSPPRAVRQFPVPEAEEKEFDIQNIVDHDPPRIGRLEPEIAVHEVDAPVAVEPVGALPAAAAAAAGRPARHRQPPNRLHDSISWDQVDLGRPERLYYNMMSAVEVYSHDSIAPGSRSRGHTPTEMA